MLSITTIPARDLTERHVNDWIRLQQADPDLSSPYFRPEFTRAVASVRRDVQVAVLEEHGGAIGFFPFQRRRRTAHPVGGRLSDFHGVIARPGEAWTTEDLLRGCGLSSWEFHHLPASQSAFTGFIRQTEGSPYLDLSAGYDAYRRALEKGHREGIAQTQRKRRKLEREIGEVRFELDCRDPAVLDQLLVWKSAQYRRTGLTDVFAFDWTVRLIHTIRGERDLGFAGLLSAVFAGDRPIAAHFGMRSHGVLHYWFPAYDLEYSRFSPGAILLMDIAQAAEDVDITRIDLGRGSEQAKTAVMSGATLVADGYAHCGSAVARARQWLADAREQLRASRLRRHLEWPLRITRPVREWMAFR